jgi:hypothetical protein
MRRRQSATWRKKHNRVPGDNGKAQIGLDISFISLMNPILAGHKRQFFGESV